MAEPFVSETFDASRWRGVAGFDALTDLTYHHDVSGRIARVAFHRPEVRNAFRPHTVDELYRALDDARQNPRIGVVLLTGNGPSAKDGGWAFCSGGDQRIRGRFGYEYESASETHGGAGVGATGGVGAGVGSDVGADVGADVSEEAKNGSSSSSSSSPNPSPNPNPNPNPSASPSPDPSARLHILEVQRLIRFMPKVVIAVVPGWAAGGGHSLHVVCDLTIASAEHARFKQTDADVGSFDAGYGSAYLAKQVGQKVAREIFFLAREYDAQRAYEMGTVNAVVPHAELEATALDWAETILTKSPTAIRMLKYAMNLTDDGMVGQQLFAGEATRLAYGTDEAVEGRDSFLQKRAPDWSPFPWQY